MMVKSISDEKQKKIDNAESEIKSASKTIDYYTSEYVIETLITKLERNDYEIPVYQRKNVWERARKSKFIESILIGLPIPFLFFWQNPDTGRLEIVDGAQRLTSIREFYQNKLKLINLEKIPSANGLYFKDLPPSRQRKFLDKSLRGIMLTEKADAEARFDLFERINTGSKIATPAEIRRGLLQGPFFEMVLKLSENKNFNELTKINKRRAESGEKDELISRFFAYGDDLSKYSDKVREFIFNYVGEMNRKFQSEPKLQLEYEKRFETIMDFFKEKYPIGFRRGGKGIVSRTRFESMTVGTYLAVKDDLNRLQQISISDCEDVFNSEQFNKAVTSDGANTKKKLFARLFVTKDAFLEKLGLLQ